MNSTEHYRKTVVIGAAAATVLLFASLPGTLASDGRYRVAVVHLKQIKPYHDLSDAIVHKLERKLETKVFGLNGDIEQQVVEQQLNKFGPDVTVAIGRKAHQFCQQREIEPLVLAYNTGLLTEPNPFCMLQYLQPKTKKVVAILDQGLIGSDADPLPAVAKRWGLELVIEEPKAVSWENLLSGNDAIILGGGVLMIKVGPAKTTSAYGPAVAVVDRSVDTYRRLEQHCVRQLPQIDEIIDIADIGKDDHLKEKLTNAEPAIILCLGTNSYQHCKFLQDRCQVLIAFEAEPVNKNISHWGTLSGVCMFVEPRDQFAPLSLLVTELVTMAVPYDPENTELLVAKALLEDQGNITLIPLPASDSSHASKQINRALDTCDGIWAIPDQTISVAPIQKFLLEESLRRKKILVAMMHPYTKRGAMMAVSSVGENNDALCEKIATLINERLNQPDSVGCIVPPSVSMSLNVRTIKKLNYKLPEFLLARAKNVFGQE
jgi:ABC-type uncharacterized transport system substrate-binding protein